MPRKSRPRDSGKPGVAAIPNDMATSWVDWMLFAVVMMIETLDPLAMVEGTAKPVMIALDREAKERAKERAFAEIMLLFFPGLAIGRDH